MKYIFGPVPSRRLGRSLGIDPTPPSESFGTGRVGPFTFQNLQKTCNWNCVYCQLGRTRPFTRARKSFFPPQDMLTELRQALQGSKNRPDWITFVGSGEPSLNLDMGDMIRAVKAETDLPVAVITNGSLLSQLEVRKELALADAVMPTLDAGNAALFRRINRPPSEYSYRLHVQGLADFREMFSGKLWLEVMLIADVNDDESSLRDLAGAIRGIAPDEVHLVLPTRPPSEPWVRPASPEAVLRALAILGEAAPVLHPDQRYGEFGTESEKDPEETAAAILARHPMADSELRRALSAWGAPDADKVILSLLKSGRAVQTERYGKMFWRGPKEQDRLSV